MAVIANFCRTEAACWHHVVPRKGGGGVSVELTDSVPGSRLGQPGFQNRLVVRIPSGTALPADYYRLVIPNTGGEVIRDIFGNVADLEFLGNRRPEGNGFEVQNFASAEAFLAAYDPEPAACLVLDVRMDGMSGIELHDELLRRGYCARKLPAC